MPWYALLIAVKNYNKSLENLQDRDQDQDLMFKTERDQRHDALLNR